MAIEFNCPFCDVLIRVPDNAGGGKGKCPSCSKKLFVPSASPPPKGASAPEQPFSFGALAEKGPVRKRTTVSAPKPEPPPFVLGEEGTAATSETVGSPSEVPSFDPSDPFGLASGSETTESSSTGSRSKQTPPKKLSIWSVIGIVALIAGLGGAGFIGWTVWQEVQGAKIEGKLIAQTADELELPPIVIESAAFHRSEAELSPVLDQLDRAPAKLFSSLMEVQLEGTKHGLRVTLHSGKAARFYRVVIEGNQAFDEFKRKESKKLDELRRKEMENAASAFCDDYRKLIAKQADQTSIGAYRDTLARPALVKGIGHQLAAVFGTTMYPCVYEDVQGAFYFLLPSDAMDFEIIGRPQEDETVLFPGKFTVEVSGRIELPKKKEEGEGTKRTLKSSSLSQPAAKSKSTEDDAEMKDDGEMKKDEK